MIVAEGVETAEQLAMMQRLDCDHAQGYDFSRPADPATTWAWAEKESHQRV